MGIDAHQALAIAGAAVGKRFGDRFGIVPMELPPSGFYSVDRIERDDWRFFSVTDLDHRHVGGCECLAIHRATGKVVFLGPVGE
jgi:hypothetical protein